MPLWPRRANQEPRKGREWHQQPPFPVTGYTSFPRRLPSIFAIQSAYADLARAGGPTWENDTPEQRADRAFDLALLREDRAMIGKICGVDMESYTSGASASERSDRQPGQPEDRRDEGWLSSLRKAMLFFREARAR